MIRSLIRTSVAILVLVAPGLGAQPTSDDLRRAGQRYLEGERSMKAGDFRAALSAFQEAYDLTKDPLVFFNIARAYRGLYGIEAKLEHLEKARDRYLSFMLEQPQSKLRPKAEEAQLEVERLIEEHKRRAAPPPPAPPPKVKSIPPPPPEPQPIVVQSQPSQEPAPSQDRPFYTKVWFWGVVAAVAVGSTIGIVLATRGTETELPAASKCPGGCPVVTVP